MCCLPRAPLNHFPLQPDARSVLLIAGGIGITPLLAMVRALQVRGADFEHRDYVLDEEEHRCRIMICVSRAVSPQLVLDL